MPPELYEQTYQNKGHFSFGKNWQEFLRTLNAERIENARQSLAEFFGGHTSVSGKTFVDIGCGSGLFSLAAYRLGAAKIVSVDIDQFSLKCTEYLWEKEGRPAHWEIRKGSALDAPFLRSLGTFDLVYSWGVLHHTGNMYHALDNILPLGHAKSFWYLALYNDNPRLLEGTSALWVTLKRLYNKSPWLGKKLIEGLYTLYYLFGLALSGRNPVSYIKNYTTLRGMNFFTDIKDWLGGYPYEFAPTEKIISFFKERGFTCHKVNPARSIGCNEYLFSKNV